MSVTPELRSHVEAWIDDDPDDATRSELSQLLRDAERDEGASAELLDRFSGTLQFGTAGLRGALAAGPNRMNRAVVIRAAAGLAAYLTATAGTGTVVIGYDARHNSDVFARDTAHVMRGAGLHAQLLPRPLPTPVLAFAVRHLGAVAGVMVTASHNPPRDNGYKVYLGDGTQIVPPADVQISREIAEVASVRAVPQAQGEEVLGDELVDAYLDAVAALPLRDSPRELAMVYTPLHGVGAATAGEVLRRAGFAAPTVVPQQAEPDPEFPTVAFPNPEEPGALDLALALAEQRGADLVVANDPDADRCAVAVPTGEGWRVLRGDELGVLLASHLLQRGARGVFATTVVSSSLLGRMARAHGVGYQETLTGFKWIGRVEGLSYGYEEALGYCVAPGLVRDKDGVSALLRVAELAAELKASGSTLLERLDDIAREYGVHATDQLSVRVDDLARIDAIMAHLRQSPPHELGGLAVETIEDMRDGTAELPGTDALRYHLESGGRVVVRPSGTEPKLKCYLEVVIPAAAAAGDLPAARAAAAARLAAIRIGLTSAAGL